MDQPARLEKYLITDPIKSFTKIAPRGSRPCRFPRRNLSPIDPIENELARDPAQLEALIQVVPLPLHLATLPRPQTGSHSGSAFFRWIVQTFQEGLLGVEPRT